jgi:malate dehydrogenase
VLIPAGVPSKGRTQSDLLKINANIAKSIVEACAKHCPQAVIGLIVNPMNSIVPAMARLYEKHKLDPMKICGITTLDVVRANKFVHEETGAPIEKINIPVVGGFSASMTCSAVPLFSQDPNASKLTPERREVVAQRLRDAGNAVTQAKKNKGTATLSMAYAGARFGQSVLAGLSGLKSEEHVLVKTSPPVCEDLEYFATRVTFGPRGVEKVHPLGNTTADEQAKLKEVSGILRDEIRAGLEYAEESDLCAQTLPSLRPATH